VKIWWVRGQALEEAIISEKTERWVKGSKYKELERGCVFSGNAKWWAICKHFTEYSSGREDQYFREYQS